MNLQISHFFRGKDWSKLYKTRHNLKKKKQKTSPSIIKFEEPTKSKNLIKIELIHKTNKYITYRLEYEMKHNFSE